MITSELPPVDLCGVHLAQFGFIIASAVLCVVWLSPYLGRRASQRKVDGHSCSKLDSREAWSWDSSAQIRPGGARGKPRNLNSTWRQSNGILLKKNRRCGAKGTNLGKDLNRAYRSRGPRADHTSSEMVVAVKNSCEWNVENCCRLEMRGRDNVNGSGSGKDWGAWYRRGWCHYLQETQWDILGVITLCHGHLEPDPLLRSRKSPAYFDTELICQLDQIINCRTWVKQDGRGWPGAVCECSFWAMTFAEPSDQDLRDIGHFLNLVASKTLALMRLAISTPLRSTPTGGVLLVPSFPPLCPRPEAGESDVPWNDKFAAQQLLEAELGWEIDYFRSFTDDSIQAGNGVEPTV
ncbi:hypothetical protein QBC44DRAFT_309630 [Cladorrhinum sp. PSN332]|nr:hypothetical protein QBC44DRAFT_309630 [Cladorrhinum sp. PSN332]